MRSVEAPSPIGVMQPKTFPLPRPPRPSTPSLMMENESRLDLIRKSLELRKRAMWIVWGSQFYLLSIIIGGLYLINTSEQQTLLAAGLFHPPGWLVPTIAIALAVGAVQATKRRTLGHAKLAKLKALDPQSLEYGELIIQSSHVWSTWNIITWVLIEAVSMVGVGDAILSGNVLVAGPYILISIALFLKERPRFDRWLETQGIAPLALTTVSSTSSTRR